MEVGIAEEHSRNSKSSNILIDEDEHEPTRLGPDTAAGKLPTIQDIMKIDEDMDLLDKEDIEKKIKRDRRKKSKVSKIKSRYIADESRHSDRINSESGYSSDTSESSVVHDTKLPHAEAVSKLYPSQNKIMNLKLKIESSPSVDEMRTILLHLSSLNMNFDLIKHTRIGAAVANVMNDDKYAKIHPFCEGILIHWIGVLPKDLITELSNPVSHDQVKAPITQESESRNWHDAMRSTFEEFMPANLASEVEAALYEAYQEGTPSRFRKLVHALRTHLIFREQLINGQLSPADFVTLPNENLNFDTGEQRVHHGTDDAESSGMTTEMFPCPECGTKRCSYYEQQVRSGDEPMTIFLTCLACKYSWSVNG